MLPRFVLHTNDESFLPATCQKLPHCDPVVDNIEFKLKVCVRNVSSNCVKSGVRKEVSAKNTWSVLAISWQAPWFPPESWTRDFPSLYTPVTISGSFMRVFRVVHYQFVSLLLPVVQHKYARSRSALSCSPASGTDLLRALKKCFHRVTPPCRRPNVEKWDLGKDIGSANESSSLEERRWFRVASGKQYHLTRCSSRAKR